MYMETIDSHIFRALFTAINPITSCALWDSGVCRNTHRDELFFRI
jgi:hypothetical protein